MSTVNLALLAFSGLVLIIGVFSRWIRRHAVSAPLCAFIIGVLLGPQVTGVFDLGTWGDVYYILEEAARFTLAVGLIGTALSLPCKDVQFRWRNLLVLLVLVNPLMWGIATGLSYWILGLAPLVALTVGASLAPTDPILARTIAEGQTARRNVPPRMRYTLLEESGFNDGLGFPFVLLGVQFITAPSLGEALIHWTLADVLLAVGGAFALGIALGYGAGKLLIWARRRDLIDRSSFFIYPIALALFSLALGRLLRIDGILVVFVVGLAFTSSGAGKDEREELQEIQGAIDNLFSLPVFFLFGLAVPWYSWVGLGWPALAIVLAVLVLRRLPVILLVRPLLAPQVRTLGEAAFFGWFGPMGISALFYATLVVRRTGIVEVWTVVSLVIAGSIVAHGISAHPLTELFGRGEKA